MVESPEIIHLILEYVVVIVEIIVGIVVAGTVIITLSKLFVSLISKLRGKEPERVRVHKIVANMLRGLLFALDLLIAADILQTILDPVLDEIFLLVLVVVIRISLSWSLSKEIEIGAKEDASANEKDH